MPPNSLEEKYVAWRNRYLKASFDGYYVYYNDDGEKGDAVTVSEAHGYGMLISVLKRNQQDFDGFVRYFDKWINHRGLMQWQQRRELGHLVPGNEGDGRNSAFDGDLDIATALFLAARVWGRSGEIDYRAKAVRLCKAIWDYTIHKRTFMPKVGDWASEENGDEAANLTRPSDFALSHFVIFWQEDIERQGGWQRVIEAIISTLQLQYSLHPDTGLVADFLVLQPNGTYLPAREKVLEDRHDPDYFWNSCRVPWRLAHYYHTSHDQRILPMLQAQSEFFAKELHKHEEIRAGYKLNGKAFVSETDLAFLAPVSFLWWALGKVPEVQKIQKVMSDLDDIKYFGETIALICLLQASVPYSSA